MESQELQLLRESQSQSISVVKMLDECKQVLTIGVKHASDYQCSKAYEFLVDYAKASVKYATNRSAIEKALIDIKPKA